jgi:hypothetical protein
MASIIKPVGKTGLEHWGGYIREDFLREMRYPQAYKRFDEMRKNSPVIGGMLTAIDQTLRSIKWQFASDSGDEDPRLEFLNEARDGMSQSWNDFISEALTMLPFGFAAHAIWYKRDKRGRMVWRRFPMLAQNTIERWDIDDDGSVNGLWQRFRAEEEYIPIERVLLFRARTEHNNPEGISILRTAWIPYYYLKNIMQIEAIGIERDLAGLPMIKLPETATTDESDTSSDANKAAKIVRNIRNDEQAGLVLPAGWDFNLVSTGGGRQVDTDIVIRRYESRILMSTLSQFLLLGQDSVGSLALSSDQTDFFTMSANAVADIIANTFTSYAVRRLLELNGMDADGVRLEHTPAGDVDTKLLGEALAQFTQAGYLTPTAQDEAWARALLRMPELEPEQIEAEKAARRALLPPGPAPEQDNQDIYHARDLYSLTQTIERALQTLEADNGG